MILSRTGISYQRPDGTVVQARVAVEWDWHDAGHPWEAGERSGWRSIWEVMVARIHVESYDLGDGPITDGAALARIETEDEGRISDALADWVERTESIV